MNVSLADVSENLYAQVVRSRWREDTPSRTFTETTCRPATLSSDSSQVSAQVGYNRLLTPHTQVALVYGYQGFDFSFSGTAFHSHIIQGMYGHRISGRMDFLVGAGPQFTHINLLTIFGTVGDQRLGVAGRARLRYKFPRTSLDLTYERFETSGSGFFAGAQSDIARLSADRPLSRVWSAFADLGYARNSRLQALSAAQLGTCDFNNSNPLLPPCPGIDAQTYSYGFVGGGLHRAFGRNFHGFVSYQFNELSFDHSYCDGLSVCSRISNRHVVTIGLDWTPRPIRLD